MFTSGKNVLASSTVETYALLALSLVKSESISYNPSIVVSIPFMYILIYSRTEDISELDTLLEMFCRSMTKCLIMSWNKSFLSFA